MDGLYAVLSVAASYPHAVAYERFASLTDQPYNSAAIQAAQLSDGRGALAGLRLLRRVPGTDRKQKLLLPSRTGRAVARVFCASPDVSDQDCAKYLSETILPVFDMVREQAPSIKLGTFCVLLAVTQYAERFGAWGDPSGLIAAELELSNLPRHFENLSSGSDKRPGLDLVELQKHPKNRRITLPKLTEKGLRLVANIAAALQHKPPTAVRFPKEEKLRDARSPEEVKDFSDDDFYFDDIERLPSHDDT